MTPSDRFRRGVGPEPRSWQVSRDPDIKLGKTAVCGSCRTPYLVRDGHACPGPRRLARTAAISGVAAAFSTMGALAIWPAPAAIPGAVAVYATCLFLTHAPRSQS